MALKIHPTAIVEAGAELGADLVKVVYTGTHDNDTVVGWWTAGVGDTTRTQAEVDKEHERALASDASAASCALRAASSVPSATMTIPAWIE